MKQTFEELIGQVAYSQHCSDMIEVIPKSKVIELLKQVRLSTLQECAKKAKLCLRVYDEFSESTESDLGQEITTERQREYVGINKDSILNLDLNSIKIDG